MEAIMAITSNDLKKPADEAEKLTPATEVAASGAMIEPEITKRIDADHVSVDNNPRKGSTPDMNRIDFNIPSGVQPEHETVEQQLKGEE
jgi:hypothetical protein